MTAPPCLVIFDIDGTLMDCRGAGRDALDAAFRAATGIADAFAAVDFRGATDGPLLRAAAAATGLPASRLPEIIRAYRTELALRLKARPPRVLDGVEPLLGDLTASGACTLGIATGNLEESAAVKLEAAALDSWFAFGGYGSDHDERAQLLRIAVERGSAGLERAPGGVVLVGDTPRDVQAALEVEVPVVAVASGGHSREELEASGAHLVVDRLSALTAPQLLSLASGQ